ADVVRHGQRQVGPGLQQPCEPVVRPRAQRVSKAARLLVGGHPINGSRAGSVGSVDVLADRLDALDARLRGLGSVLVAFSGGADSAFLLAAAARALGPEHVVAATAVSPSLAQEELPAAAAFARQLGLRHLTPTTDELSREGYVANGAD